MLQASLSSTVSAPSFKAACTLFPLILAKRRYKYLRQQLKHGIPHTSVQEENAVTRDSLLSLVPANFLLWKSKKKKKKEEEKGRDITLTAFLAKLYWKK